MSNAPGFIKQLEVRIQEQARFEALDHKVKEGLAKIAHKTRLKMLEVKRNLAENFIEMATLVHIADKDEHYIALGFETISEYLEAPEEAGGIAYSRGWLIQVRDIYRKFVLELHKPAKKIAEYNPTNLRAIKNIVTPENVDFWLKRAKANSRSDLVKEVRDKDHSLNEALEDPLPISWVVVWLNCFRDTFEPKEPFHITIERCCKLSNGKLCPRVAFCERLAPIANDLISHKREGEKCQVSTNN